MNASDDATIANRYLANQLTEVERTGYERQLAQSPEAVAELEATARLKVGLETLRERGAIRDLLQTPTRSTWIAMLPLAAALGAVCVGVALWYPYRAPSIRVLAASASELTVSSGHPLPIVQTAVIYRKRAATVDAVIELPTFQGIVEWRWISPLSAEPRRYDLALSRIHEGQAPHTVATIEGLSPNEERLVKWYSDASRMTPGLYKVTLTEQGAPRPAKPESFLVEVRAGTRK